MNRSRGTTRSKGAATVESTTTHRSTTPSAQPAASAPVLGAAAHAGSAGTAEAGGRRGGLAGRYYTDQTVFDAEMDRIFAQSWVMAGHMSEVSEPGTVLTVTVGDEGVLIVNDAGRLRAMYNVCQHRGHELVTAQTARVDRIVCPYHAWTYGLDGRLLHARGESVGEICVPAVRLETLAGFMFVNLSADSPPLADFAPGVERQLLSLAPDAAQRVRTARRTHELRSNWKVVVENYNECYHCPNVHKWFTSGVIAPGSYRISPRGNVITHTAEGPRKPSGPPESEPSASSSGYGSFYTWPASSIQCYPGGVLNTFRWVPLAVDRTLLIREWWLSDAEPTEAEAKLISDDWEKTVWEDFAIVESVQRGVRSRGYRPGPLIEHPSGVCDVHSENSVSHLQDLLLEGLGEVA